MIQATKELKYISLHTNRHCNKATEFSFKFFNVLAHLNQNYCWNKSNCL